MPVSGDIGLPNKRDRFRGEQLVLEPLTSDPASTQAGDMWLRTDLNDTGQGDTTNQIATVRYDDGSTIHNIPVYQEGTAVNGTVEVVGAFDSVQGYVPARADGDNPVFPEWGFQHAGTRYGLHNYFGASAIPDSGLLHARYDATELGLSDGNTVDPFPDETATGFDLAADGGPTYTTSVINGNAVVREDGTDDRNAAALGSSISQPFAYFWVCNIRSVDGGANEFYVDDDANPVGCRVINNLGEWQLGDSGANANGGSISTGNHIVAAIFDGANSKLRVDGSDEVTASLSDSTGGLSLGARGDNSLFSPIDFGEFLFYDGSPTTADVESYLSDKWGVTI